MAEAQSEIPDWPTPRAAAEASDLAAALIDRLAEADGPADEAGTWPESLWRELAEAGAPLWSLPIGSGGTGCERATLLLRYARIAEGSLTAAFILSQHDAAVRRLATATGPGRATADGWLRAIADGRAFATVGISQLTTSRRHGARALVASGRPESGFRLDGAMPWVTAAPRADLFVTGAVLDDGRQILVALPADRAGLTVRAPFPLAALQASCTCEVACDGVEIDAADVLAGPSDEVMKAPGQVGTGGLETSALALGQARAALVAMAAERVRREDLTEPAEALADAWRDLAAAFLAAAEGRPDAPPAAEVRARANALVLRCTQAYLTARKGTGFLRTEPAQRWARQALFFLVWSCPAPVAQSALRDLAGLCPA
jgi:alkylation response protein AidB-like acyl-CoA dehydrogenase